MSRSHSTWTSPGRTDPFEVDTALLGGSGRWQNLGLWPVRTGGTSHSPNHPIDYDHACERLAQRVGEAAHLTPGQRVLELGAGSGAGLELWRDRFGVQAQGMELPLRARPDMLAREFCLERRDGVTRLAAPGPFDAVLAVDSAYHLAPIGNLAAAIARSLAPDGVVALTTLTARWPLSRAIEPLAHMPRAALVSDVAVVFRTCFQAVVVEDLSDEVLGGFARHVATCRPGLSKTQRRSAAWRKIAATANLARLASLGLLGYVLVRAKRPR